MDRTTSNLHLAARGGPPALGSGLTFVGVLVGVFCLPFVAFGLFAALEGVRRIGTGGEQGAFMLLFGLAFLGLPALALLRLRKGMGRLGKIAALHLRHPDEPWRWTDRWRGGRIRCGNRGGMLVSWIFALVWNALSLPLLFALPEELAKGNHAILIGLLFPLFGVGMIVWAVRATLRWRRFGASIFELTQMPGVLGGKLEGTLHVGNGLAEARELNVGISCIRRRVTGSGKSRSTHEDVLWSDEAQLSGSALLHGPKGLMLPLSLALPYDAEPSDPGLSDDRVLWRLEVSAEIPGIDYTARFEVPVFRTDESDASRTMAARSRQRGTDEGILDPRTLGLPVAVHPDGGMEIVFPAGRRKAPAFITTIVGAVFGGASWLCHSQGAPAFFSLILALFTLGIGYGALHLWLGSTRLRIRSEDVVVESRLLFLRSRRVVPREEIVAVLPESGMRSGNRVWWDLRLRTVGAPRGKRMRPRGVRVPAYLSEKRDADRLASWVSRELSL
jgi:hypothetical protein